LCLSTTNWFSWTEQRFNILDLHQAMYKHYKQVTNLKPSNVLAHMSMCCNKVWPAHSAFVSFTNAMRSREATPMSDINALTSITNFQHISWFLRKMTRVISHSPILIRTNAYSKSPLFKDPLSSNSYIRLSSGILLLFFFFWIEKQSQNNTITCISSKFSSLSSPSPSSFAECVL
jgi:hypothetical protein